MDTRETPGPTGRMEPKAKHRELSVAPSLEGSVRIGVVACEVMRLELDLLLKDIPEIADVIYLEVALHCYPERMKGTIKEKVSSLVDKVDVIFLGYGYCRSLEGIDKEFGVPVVMPQMDDCIQILMTPEKYHEQIRREVGTWFMTPGWAEIGVDMVIKENKLERAAKYGKDPLEMAKRLFTHYRRGLYLDTGVGNNNYFLDKAKEFCEILNLTLEQTTATSRVLQEHLKIAQKIGMKQEARISATTVSENLQQVDRRTV